jgi:hypothetical protein
MVECVVRNVSRSGTFLTFFRAEQFLLQRKTHSKDYVKIIPSIEGIILD